MPTQHQDNTPQRLQKIIARAGICSRREAETLIASGRVRVDGQTVTLMGSKVDPSQSEVTVDGKPLKEEQKMYILLNKPRGYVTTLSDPQGRPIVTDLLTELPVRLFPVGRLDLDTEGALLMTNDGALSNYILHPKYEVNKTYKATVQGTPSVGDLNLLADGIILEGRKTAPALARVLRRLQGKTQVEIIIHEGRKGRCVRCFRPSVTR